MILVLDASRPLEGEQTFLIKRFPESLRVVNKVDAKVGWDISAIKAIQTVGTTGSGVDELMRQIRAHFNCETIDPNRARCWTQRQRDQILTIKPKN